MEAARNCTQAHVTFTDHHQNRTFEAVEMMFAGARDTISQGFVSFVLLTKIRMKKFLNYLFKSFSRSRSKDDLSDERKMRRSRSRQSLSDHKLAPLAEDSLSQAEQVRHMFYFFNAHKNRHF